MEVEAAQNIPKVSRPKAKHWAGCTLPNYTPLDEIAFQVAIKPLADYWVYGKETGADGLKHLQFMVCFKKQTLLSAAKKLLPTQGHWEIKHTKSTMLRASNYCKKGIFLLLNVSFINYLGEQSHEEWNTLHEEGPNFGLNAVFEEFGELPADSTVKGRDVIMANYEDTLEKARAGNVEDINAEHYLKVYYFLLVNVSFINYLVLWYYQ